MALDSSFSSSLRAALDAAPSSVARSPPPPLQPLSTFTDSPLAPSSPAKPAPPRLKLGVALSPVEGPRSAGGAGRPALTIQPASPNMSSSAVFASPTSPFPPPIPSTSTTPVAPSFQPPPSPQALGGGLAARRAAKLGKKRLSLVVPTNPHSTTSPSGSLLSPTSPSYLRPHNSDLDETRSLPPSPISLTTFIGTEGAEAPDRTIGRLMLKQQADEMREQMRGGRGMKRRTSIPRLNLVASGAAAAKPDNLDNYTGSSSSQREGGGGASGGGAGSAVQLIRGDAIERRGGESGDEGGGEVEEFPYALGPREILPGVFLGSEQNAKDAKVLREWRIGFVLNVAKEVECPWVDETVAESELEDAEEEDDDETPPARTPWGSSLPPSNGSKPSDRASPLPTPPPDPPSRHSHRRTKTQAAVPAAGAVGTPSASEPAAAPPTRPVRPPFIRPTASTPNLHAAYAPSSPRPPVPAIPAIHIPGAQPAESSSSSSGGSAYPVPALAETMQRSLSSSPPVPRRSPPRPLRLASTTKPASSASASTPVPASRTTSTRSPGAVRIARNARTGRPALEYLWLKWGHDESDLVEAKKFQAAFDFLDEARERGERVLVHCQCGVSRSATVVIAYCMREAARALEEGRDAKGLEGCTGMHDTYSFVKEKSEWVGPNLSLVFQLVAYERTLRGDSFDAVEDDEEGGYPNYPPELSSPPPPTQPLSNGFANHHGPDPDDDRPPPSAIEGSFVFPPPLNLQRSTFDRPSASSSSSNHLPPLRSPRTPISSEGSMPESQLSTPDLHDPLISPTFSTDTKASSVTSTPLSSVERNGLPSRRIHVVEPDEGATLHLRDRHSSMDTIVAGADVDEEDHNHHRHFDERGGVGVGVGLGVGGAGAGAGGARETAKAPFFVLPVPPTDPHPLHILSPEAISPTVAHHPRPARAAPPLLSLSVPPSPAPVLTAITSTATSTAAVASPPAMSPNDDLIIFSPLSASTASAPSPHPSMVSSTSSTSLASVASGVSGVSGVSGASTTLSRSNSKRFGTGQTPSQRRASHRRIMSDTIRLEQHPLALTSTQAPGGRTSPAPASGLAAQGREGECEAQ
ncbi:hypothetical protein JCM6882_005665 [Rhodosporidiobolus microsporus]